MRVVLIGATGHIGGYLVPRLVEAGHEVVAISRGQQRLYREDPSWASVERVTADRAAEDAEGVFGRRIADLAPDAVIDLVCFTAESAEHLIGALAGTGIPLIECGSIWMHGVLHAVPARETDPREPWGEYGIGKLAIERRVLAATERGDVRGTVLHPGHISGPGWPVINPAGNLDPRVWETLAAGERTVLPGSGTETLHHVHADDVAQAFQLALERIDAAAGRAFHVVSDRALTLRGYAEGVADWFGVRTDLEFVPLDEFARTTTPEHAEASAEHLRHSPAASIEAAREALGYAPRFTSLAAAREAVEALAAAGRVRLPAFA